MREPPGLFFYLMRLEIANWEIQKAQKYREDEKTIPVRLVANRLRPDKELDQILPEAFSKSTVDFFLKEGVVDWQHESKTGPNMERRAAAILGSPIEFAWEDGLPVVYANLTKSHPIVKNSILPHLEAGQRVFGASIGGQVFKASPEYDPDTKTTKRNISQIHWDHIAIAGRPYVMSDGSEVSLAKSITYSEAAIPSEIAILRYSDIDVFLQRISLIDQEDTLTKALEVGNGTNIANYTGMDALREQALEGDKKSRSREIVNGYLKKLMNNEIPTGRDSLKKYLKDSGVPEDRVDEVTNRTCEVLEKSL